ncbi:MAG: class I SAM-dependent methyltransferase [Alphaproteobacteria bacterium]|nr:class I SAM-dependent methyltransferase [Alphaproteobacteria bacterium]
MPQFRHAMLVDVAHDERSRQDFTAAFKSHLSSNVAAGTKLAYERRAKPTFARTAGRAPQDRHEVRRILSADSYYQAASSLKRTAQELMWDSVGDCVERQLDRLVARAKTMRGRKGSLRTDPKLVVPRYHSAVDIHCMPGGYHGEIARDDVYAGALYDRGIYLFSMGLRGELNDDFGQSLVAWTKRTFPDFRPKRILDMGCSVGHGTLPWVDGYPKAEVHAFDIGAPMVRYAHARAVALGKTVHYSQQNAERTDFPDAHFDLVVSQIIIHETSRQALPRILRECHRLLKPGGIMLHMDGVDWANLDPYDAFVPDWDTYFNNEPFIGPMHDLDLPALAVEAGFARKNVIFTSATSARRDRENQGRRELTSGDFGNVGAFMVFGAVK